MDNSGKDKVKPEACDPEARLGHQQLAAGALGTYLPNVALIRLSSDAAFWLPQNDPTLDRLNVFVHEYLHYLHNFSTVAGIYGFVAQLRLTALFTSTVGLSGRAYGMSVLLAEEAGQVTSTLQWREYLYGSARPPFNERLYRTGGKLQLIGVRRHQEVLQLCRQEVPLDRTYIDLEVSSSTSPAQPVSIDLGSYVLMESLAFEVEKMISQNHGFDAAKLDAQTPMFPYKVCRCLFEGIAGIEPTSELLAKALLLSLQSTNPGAAFVSIAEQFHNTPDSGARQQILTDLTERTTAELRQCEHGLRTQILDTEAARFRSRGAAGRGIASMLEHCKQYLRLRIEKPYFELDTLAAGPDRDAFVDLLKSCPPCLVLQDTDPTGAESSLTLFSESEPDPAALDELGAMQGLLQFVSSHLTSNGFVPTSAAQRARCKLFSACTAPLAMSNSPICKERPWESFRPEQASACWYSAGVGVARGRACLA